MILEPHLLLVMPCVVLSLAGAVQSTEPAQAQKAWVGVSVSEPLVTGDRLMAFQVFFAMLNDGTEPIDPKDRTWKINVNEKDHPDSQFVFFNGPRQVGLESLSPGEHMLFGYPDNVGQS